MRIRLEWSFYAVVEQVVSLFSSATGQCVGLKNLSGDLIAISDTKKKTGDDTHLICLKQDLRVLFTAVKGLEKKLGALMEELSSPLVLVKVKDKSKIRVDDPDLLTQDLFMMYHKGQAERYLIFNEDEVIAFIKGTSGDKKFKKLVTEVSQSAELGEEVERFLAEVEAGSIDNPSAVASVRSQIEQGEFAPLLSKN